ncbi:MAG: NAD(P)-dependent oxidoreductase [Peptococcaceae bacterium]|nr:NAD(P)-dependent oxidoreductase [Peptococcaceae bacterium]
MRIGFIGLGAMGRPMAKNLLKAGHSLTVYDVVPAAAEALAAEGAQTADSLAKVAASGEVVITMLPGDKQIKQVLLSDEFTANLKPGTVILDMTSCAPDSIVEVEGFYKPKGIMVADAPVSGNVEGAVAGTLSIFAAGDDAALKKVWPLLEVMGKQLFSLGACGTGKAFKNLNNLLSISNLVIISEMFHVAQKRGYDMDSLYDMICASTGMSMSFKNRFKRMVDDNYDNGFKLSLARKDYANALAMGEGVPMPVCKLINDLLLANSKHDDVDMAVICKLFEGA